MDNSEKTYLEQTLPFVEKDEIEENGKLLARIGFRLGYVPYVIIGVGISMILISRNIYVILVAAMFIVLGVLYIIRIKDHPTMDIYDDAVIFYSDWKENRLARVPYEEITEWSVESKEGGISGIKFRFVFYPEIIISTFQLDKAARALSVKLHERETRIKNQKKAMSEKLEFRNPFDRFKKK